MHFKEHIRISLSFKAGIILIYIRIQITFKREICKPVEQVMYMCIE